MVIQGVWGARMCIFMSKQEPDSLGGTEEHQKWGSGLIGGGGAHES